MYFIGHEAPTMDSIFNILNIFCEFFVTQNANGIYKHIFWKIAQAREHFN